MPSTIIIQKLKLIKTICTYLDNNYITNHTDRLELALSVPAGTTREFQWADISSDVHIS